MLHSYSKATFLTFSLVALFYASNAQQAPTINWSKALSTNSKDTIWCVKQTKDSGYILCGSTQSVSGNHGGNDFWIVKVTKNGVKSWQKTYGGSGDDVAKSVCQTYNGSFIVAGYSNSIDGDVGINNGGYDTWILFLDSLGNHKADQIYGGSSDDKPNSIIQLNTGNYVISGSSNSTDQFSPGLKNNNIGGSDVWLFEINNSTSIVWSKNVGGTSNDYANSLIQTKDGGFLIAGTTNSNDNGITNSKGTTIYSSTGADSSIQSYNFWVVKTDNVGTIQWQKSIGNTPTNNYDYDVAYSANQTFDGGYIVAGNTGIVKLDKSGNQVWKNTNYTSPNINEGQLAVEATDSSSYTIASNGGLYSLDTLNKTSKTIEVSSNTTLNYINSFIQTKDSGYVVVGNTTTNGFPSLIKISSGKPTGTYTPAPTKTIGLPTIKDFTGTAYSYGISLFTGDVTTIEGKYLSDVTSVSFGSNAAASFTVINDSTITATVGSISYPGYVTVTTGTGLKASSINKYYQGGVPVITNFTGTQGSYGTYLSTGDVTTIKGKYFLHVNSVKFGGSAAISYSVDNDSTITASVGAINKDSGYIELYTNDGTSDSSATKFYHGIIINNISGVGTYHYPGEVITIKGKYFTGANVVINYLYSTTSPQFSNLVISDDNTILATVGSGGSSAIGYIKISNSANHFLPDSSNASTFSYCPGVPKIKSTPGIIATPSSNITAGTDVTFFDSVNNQDSSGSSYSYQWYLNNSLSIYRGYYYNSVLETGDQIFAVLTATNCGISTSATSNIVTMTVSGSLPNYTWTGRNGTDWSDGNNWSNATVPNNTNDVIIPKYPIQSPTISSPAVVNNLAMNSNINISSDNTPSLTIDGTVNGPGYVGVSDYAPNFGDIIINGSNSSNWAGVYRIKNLTINGNNNNFTAITTNLVNIGTNNKLSSGYLGYELGSSISGTLYQNAGSLILDNLQLPSGSVVAPVTGSITGTATVWRTVYLGNREFRDLGAGVANAGNIFKNWQNNGVTGTTGIFITGSQNATPNLNNNIDTTNGLDVTLTGNPSMYHYNNNSNVWNPITNTKTTLLDPYTGYRVLVRGDRSNSNLLYSQSNNLMWSNSYIPTTGNLITGDVTFGTSGVTGQYASSYLKLSGTNSFSFIANPYHSPVSWSAILADSKNISASYWYQDPTIYSLPSDSSYTQAGTVYVTYNSIAGTSSNPSSSIGEYLQPGQAFFVQSTSATPSVVFKETSKGNIGDFKNNIFGTSSINKIFIGLSKANHNIDGSVCVFKSGFDKAIGIEDSWKIPNSGENISIKAIGKDLSIDGLPLPVNGDSLMLHLYNLQPNTAYTIKLDASHFSSNGITALVKDKVLNNYTKLSNDTTLLSFITTNDTSAFSDRYSIVFTNNTLPVNSINADVLTDGHETIVKWTTIGNSNALSYTIQHSMNNRDFTDIFSEKAQRPSFNYSFTDKNTVDGNNYYRIKETTRDGSISFSNVVWASINNSKRISIYPNPLSGNSFGINLGSFPTGNYEVKIINILGEKISTKAIKHSLGIIDHITLDNKLIPGSYTIEVTDDKNQMNSCRIIIK